MLTLLRELYIRGVATLGARKLQEYIDTNCLACVEPDCGLNQAGHNICLMMGVDEQVRRYLPDILEKMTPQEISTSIVMIYRSDTYLRHAIKKMLRDRVHFSVRTFVYICNKDLLTDMIFQARIAEAVFNIRCTTRCFNSIGGETTGCFFDMDTWRKTTVVQ